MERLDPLALETRILPAAGVEALQLPHGMRAQRSTPVRDPLEPGGSEDHEVSIPSEAHLESEGVGPLVDRGFEGDDGVLGRLGGRSTLSDDERLPLNCVRHDLRGTLIAWARPS